MYENDHAPKPNATSPDAHQEPNRRPQENPPGHDRPKPGGPVFPVQSDPDPEPEKPGAQ